MVGTFYNVVWIEFCSAALWLLAEDQWAAQLRLPHEFGGFEFSPS
jgi:hypothetical protein